MPKPVTFEPGTEICLKDISSEPGKTKHDKQSAEKKIRENALAMADLARRLYAENKHAVLLVLQGMDTAGKDGTIRSVMSGMNPRSCQVVSFKQPSLEELDHDFLWRVHHVMPRLGNIGIFNRSHYEDVIVVRVHNLVPEPVWQGRYELINAFEHLLTECNTTIVKCYLHISKEAQRERLQARIDEPESNWKFSFGDLEERKLWDQYQEAYQVALNRCNTADAPWYIIPSDKKWYRNLVVSDLMRRTLEDLDPQFPAAETDLTGVVVE